MVAEDSEVNAAAADNVTQEAIGSPLAMWELEIQNIELEKGEGGLGFSILDYQVGNLPVTYRFYKKLGYCYYFRPYFYFYRCCIFLSRVWSSRMKCLIFWSIVFFSSTLNCFIQVFPLGKKDIMYNANQIH